MAASSSLSRLRSCGLAVSAVIFVVACWPETFTFIEGGTGDAGDAVDAVADGALEASCGDTTTDPSNCGACGYTCVNGRTCVASRCTPAWQAISTSGAPAPRDANSQGIGVAVAGKLLVAGGISGACGPSLATGGIYDPSTNAWSTVPDLNSARSQYQLASDGTTAYAFGGLPDCSNGSVQIGTLESWKPGDASWSTLTAADAPSARYAQEAAWTGSTLFVYGGASGVATNVTSGSTYNPMLNQWSDASCSLSGCERNDAYSWIDDGYVRLWAGVGGNAPAGLQFEIATNIWSAWTPPTSFPTGLGPHIDDGRRVMFTSPTAASCTSNIDVVLYDRATQLVVTDAATSPAGMSTDPAVAWTGAELIAWSGACGAGVVSSIGGRYQPPAPSP